MDVLDRSMARLDETLDRMDARLDETFNRTNARLDGMIAKLDDIRVDVSELRTESRREADKTRLTVLASGFGIVLVIVLCVAFGVVLS